MDEAKIKQYAKLMKEEDLTALEITEADVTIRLERSLSGKRVIEVPEEAEPAAANKQPKAEPGTDDIFRSEMVGIAYLAPTENSEPYVKAGDKVKAGDVLCIIEAMKLMNEIQAEWDGTVTEVFVENGQVVEFGTPLFKIER